MTKKKLPLKPDSYGFFLLKQYFHLSTMWRMDANLYLNSFHDEYTNYRVYKKLLQLGFIEEYKELIVKDIKANTSKSDVFVKLDHPSRSKYAVTNITKSGINYLVDNCDNQSEQDYFYKYATNVHSRFRTSSVKTFLKNLNQSHVLMMMSCAGAKVYPNEKPSLYHLYGTLTKTSAYNKAMDHSDRFQKYNFMNKDEIESIKSTNGFFYTLDEFREFDKAINGVFTGELIQEIKDYASKTDEHSVLEKYNISLQELNNYKNMNMLISEEYRSSKLSGIFISDKRCLLVYLSEPTTNKLIYISNAEAILKSKIDMYFSEIMNYDKYTMLINGENRTSSIDGLVLSDGNSMIYSMATGKKSGRFKQREGDDIAKLYTPHSILLHDNDLFQNIFVVPSTKTGITSLQYLLNHSVKDYDEDCYKQVKDHPDLFVCEERRGEHFSYGYAKENDGKYENLPRSVIFMPVAEVNTLFQLSLRSSDQSDYYERYAFITYPELVNAISHSIRKDACLYYEVEDNIIYIYKNSTSEENVKIKKRLYFLSSFESDSNINKYKGFSKEEIEALYKITYQNHENTLESFWTIPQLEAYMLNFYNHKEINLKQLCKVNLSEKDMKFCMPENILEYNYFGHLKSKEDFYDTRNKNLLEKKKKYKNKIIHITIHTTDKEKIATIKSAAKSKNMSVSAYAINIIYEQALKDIKERDKDTKESVARFRKRYEN